MKSVCYNLKNLMNWTSEELENTQKTLAGFLTILWLLMMQHGRINHLVSIRKMKLHDAKCPDQVKLKPTSRGKLCNSVRIKGLMFQE